MTHYMMAADSNTFSAWFITFVLFSLLVSVELSSASPQTEEKNKFQVCTDGTYKHGGLDCCLCAPGLQVKEHCNTSQQYGTCQPCKPETYSSHPNDQKSCEPCTSCSQQNANLEVDEPCTPARDTKCRCKKDHFCSSGKETCRICYACQTCAHGIKVACTANNNTVCKDKSEGGHHVGITVCILVLIVLAIVGGGAVFFWRKRKRQQIPAQSTNGTATDLERQHLRDVDLEPHLPDIADAIGWKDMKDLAMRNGIPNTAIDACKLDHPGDSHEWTLQLLRIWGESQGKMASENLIKNLQRSSKKRKAESVINILSGGSPDGSNAS